MEGRQVLVAHDAASNASLFGHQDDWPAGALEARQGSRHAGQELELLPATHIRIFRQFPVQDAVAIKKYRRHGALALIFPDAPGLQAQRFEGDIGNAAPQIFHALGNLLAAVVSAV